MPELRASIRLMRRDDVAHVMAIDRFCFPIPWSEQAFQTEVGNPSAYYVVAELDGVVCGFAGCWIVMDETHITTLGVNPAQRRSGIGEQLLSAILNEALRRGARRASLEVRTSNRSARQLYEKFGFRQVGSRAAYYSDNGEDAAVMWIEDMTRPASRAVLEARFAVAWDDYARSGN